MGEPNEGQGVVTSAEQTETSEQNPETFTKEQMVEAGRKAKSDVLAEFGRLKTSTEVAIKSAQAAQARIERMQEEQDELDRAKYRDEPDKLSAITERIGRRNAETKLAKAEQDLSELGGRVEAAERKESESTKERNAREIATRLNVNPTLLAKLAKLTDGSLEAIEVEANGLPRLGETKPSLKTDDGKTSGVTSGKKPTLEELQASDPFETQKKVDSGEWKL